MERLTTYCRLAAVSLCTLMTFSVTGQASASTNAGTVSPGDETVEVSEAINHFAADVYRKLAGRRK